MFGYLIILSVWARLILSVRPTFVSSCQDIDTQACQLFYNKNNDICNNNEFGHKNCRRFCGNCPRECYFCEEAVINPADCNTTKSCDPQMLCVTKTLIIKEEPNKYIMTCAEKEICDGLVVGFHLGKRDSGSDAIDSVVTDEGNAREKRDISFECCDKDYCNIPNI